MLENAWTSALNAAKSFLGQGSAANVPPPTPSVPAPIASRTMPRQVGYANIISNFMNTLQTGFGNAGQQINNAVGNAGQQINNAAGAVTNAYKKAYPTVYGMPYGTKINFNPQNIPNLFKPEVMKGYANDVISPLNTASQYVQKFGQNLLETGKSAAKLSPPYVAYRSVTGNPVGPLEYGVNTLNTGFGALNAKYGTTPLAPILGPALQIAGDIRRGTPLTNANLTEEINKGVLDQPGFGQVFTDDPKTQRLIDLAFLGVMVLGPAARKKITPILDKTLDNFRGNPLTFEDAQAVTIGRGTPEQIANYKRANKFGNIVDIIKANSGGNPKLSIWQFLNDAVQKIKIGVQEGLNAGKPKLLESGVPAVEPLPMTPVTRSVGITPYVGMEGQVNPDKQLQGMVDQIKVAKVAGDQNTVATVSQQLLSTAQNQITNYFSDNPDIKFDIQPSSAHYFGEQEPTLIVKATMPKTSEGTFLRKIAKMGQNWGQDTIHVSEILPTIDQNAILGKEFADGFVFEPNVDFRWSTALTEPQKAQVAAEVQKLGLAGDTFHPDGMGMNLYNITKFKSNAEFRKQVGQIQETLGKLNMGGVQGVNGQGIGAIERIDSTRRLLVAGNAESGATRSYGQLSNYISPAERPAALQSPLQKVGSFLNKNVTPGLTTKPISEAERVTNLQNQQLEKAQNPETKTPTSLPEVLPESQIGVPQEKVSQPIIPPGQKERGFITTVKESAKTPKKAKTNLTGFYTPTTNPQDIANANNTLQTLGWDKAKQIVISGPHTAENSMLAQVMASEAFKQGKYDEGDALIEAVSVKATQAGQGNQALALWSRFTPEGMVRYAKTQLEKAVNTMPLLNRIIGTKVKDWTPEDSKFITETMRKINSLPEGQEKLDLTTSVFEYISKKLPWGISNVIDEFRYNNMLSNPLTHLRNAINNIQQAYMVRPMTLAAEGRPLEAAKYEIGALKAIPDAIDTFVNIVKTGSTLGKMDVTNMGSQLRVPKKLGRYNLPSDLMEAADKFFTTIIKSGEMARGSTPEAAALQAEYSLFRADLNPKDQGFVLNKIDDVTRAVYQLRKVGLGWFIPFIRTPMNVAKQWIEYSPLGVSTIPGSASSRTQIAKALLGSIATLIGASAALQGRTTWDVPTDPTQKKLFYDSGRKPFSVKIGDMWVPMQTFGVFALALALPAAVKYFNEESRTATTDDQITKLTKMMLSPLGFWSQQTFVSGLGSFVNMAQGNTDFSMTRNLTQTASQLIPWAGLQRYVSTIVDTVFRKPDTNSFSQQLSSGIPFLTKNLPAYEDSQGNISKRNWSNYVAPYAMGKANPTFEQPYQERGTKLQTNAEIAAAGKKVEQTGGSVDVGNTTVYWNPVSASYKTIDKITDPTTQFYITNLDTGNKKFIDLGTPINIPMATGNDTIDKNLISTYKSDIKGRIDDVIALYQDKQLTLSEAGAMVDKLQAQYDGASGGKQAAKIAYPKFSVPKLSKLKRIKAPKLAKMKSPKYGYAKLAKYKPVQSKLTKVKALKTPKMNIRSFV
jgi:hypothetical protein